MLAFFAVAQCFAACSGPNFTNAAPAAGGGGTSGSGGLATGGGEPAGGGGLPSGGTGAAGAGGTATGGAGTGGTAAGDAGMAGAVDTCQCGPAQYCRAGTCLDCADLSKLDFGNAEEVLDFPSGALRFPRAGGVEGSLFYTLVTSTVSELWYAPDIALPPGRALDDGLVPRTGLVYFGDPGGLGFDVLFDEKANDGRRSIRAATWDGTKLGAAFDAPAPLAPSGADDYSVAFASKTKRVYFMTTRSGAPELVTGTLGSDAVKSVSLELPGQGGGACARTGDDAAPWVTGDGRLLLFAAPPVDAACNSVDGDATDLFVALVNAATGLPIATAVSIAGVNHATDASSETEASFTADLCALYFASDGGGVQGHDYRLYRALRR